MKSIISIWLYRFYVRTYLLEPAKVLHLIVFLFNSLPMISAYAAYEVSNCCCSARNMLWQSSIAMKQTAFYIFQIGESSTIGFKRSMFIQFHTENSQTHPDPIRPYPPRSSSKPWDIVCQVRRNKHIQRQNASTIVNEKNFLGFWTFH